MDLYQPSPPVPLGNTVPGGNTGNVSRPIYDVRGQSFTFIEPPPPLHFHYDNINVHLTRDHPTTETSSGIICIPGQSDTDLNNMPSSARSTRVRARSEPSFSSHGTYFGRFNKIVQCSSPIRLCSCGVSWSEVPSHDPVTVSDAPFDRIASYHEEDASTDTGTVVEDQPVLTTHSASTPSQASVTDDSHDENRTALDSLPDRISYSNQWYGQDVEDFFVDAIGGDTPSPSAVDAESATPTATVGPSSPSAVPMVPCLYNGCTDSIIPRRRYVRRHMSLVHGHNFKKEGSLFCLWADCHRKVQNHYLQRHIVDAHLGLLAKACDRCSKLFSRADALKYHQLTCCVCHACKDSFRNKDELARHGCWGSE